MTRTVVYAGRTGSGENHRHAAALGTLDDVRVIWIEDVAAIDAIDGIDFLVTTQETLLEAVARACELRGIPGIGVNTVRNTLDKTRFKETLARAGVKTAATRDVANPRFPLIVKPLGGSGGLGTWCIRNREQLDVALALLGDAPFVAEEALTGEELCYDTVTVNGEPRVESICRYAPPILTALESPDVQWTCVMPRELAGYEAVLSAGRTALGALGIGTAMTHMECIVTGDGVHFIDATLRPAGARIAPMLAFAYDVDPYRAWARAMVDGAFDGPWDRRHAVGTVFLRGVGEGHIAHVDGLDRLPDSVVDARLPRVGAMKSPTYTGDGYITVRDRDTERVEALLAELARKVRITYSDAGADAALIDRWRERANVSKKQLCRPAWDEHPGRPLHY